jgi:hypothetical protein
MVSRNTKSSFEPGPVKVPRLVSLHHRLQRARNADGQRIPLVDELLFFLDDPPPGTGDRWQAGADLCERHGIKTSRMAVWRFYRANILQWRREQNPAPPAQTSDPLEMTRLQEQARHLAAQRAVEMLHDPRLSPGHLIGLLQNDNLRQQIQLARDQFADRLAVRRRAEERERLQRIEDEVRDRLLVPVQMESLRKILTPLATVPAHTTT